MKALGKGISVIWSWINKINRMIGFLMLLAIIYCIGGQIFSRWLFGHVWAWSEETAEVCLIGLIVLFNGYAEQTDEHVRLEVLFSLFPKLRAPMLFVGRLATMFMCGFIMYTEYMFIPSVAHASTKVVHIPLTVIHGMIFVGFLLYFIDLAINEVKQIRGIPVGQPEEMLTFNEIVEANANSAEKGGR